MREDMFKVIVERPRVGAGWQRKGRTRPWDEESPTREPTGERARGRSKSLNENLAPLRRFLEKNVGRPWDKVFSELCANLSVASAVQKHVRDHLRDFVQLEPIDSEIRWRRRRLYVCPRTGLLRRRRSPRPVRPAPPVTSIPIDTDHTWELVDGQWYRVRWVATDDVPRWDAVAKRLVSRKEARRRAVEKRQCGKKELARVRGA